MNSFFHRLLVFEPRFGPVPGLRSAKIRNLFGLAITLSLWFWVSGCQPDVLFIEKSVPLQFSADTVYLDTVFAQVGSSTRSVRVINPTKDNLRIQRIALAGGVDSPFRININGASGPSLENVELLAGDSLWIFIEVTAPPQGNQFLYTDSIVIQTGTVIQDIDLVTLALDAHFHYPTQELVIPQGTGPPLRIPYVVLPPHAVWTNDKPHVVYGYIVVDSAQTFTIEPGTQIHFHNNSGLWVYKNGTLLVDPLKTGSAAQPVVFQGDRLEPFYRTIPGQWGGVLGGIFIQQGAKAVIHHAVIKNGTIGIRVDSTGSATQPDLILTNSVLEHHSRAGIYSGFGNIRAENTIIGEAGLYGLYALGGWVSMDHCTLANMFSGARSTPTLGLFNYYEDAQGIIRTRPLWQADFSNCIVTGNNTSEVGIGKVDGAAFGYFFDGCLLQINPNPNPPRYTLTDPTHFKDCLFNLSAQLNDPFHSQYGPDTNSPVINAGKLPAAQRVPLDFYHVSRLPYPDLGAIEFP